MHWILVYFYVFDVSFMLALLLTPVFKQLSFRLGCVDQPNLERKIHTQAMPLLGGFAVFVAFALNVLFNYLVVVLAAAHLNLPDDLSIHVAGVLSVWPKLVVLLVGGLLMVMLGAYDDRHDLRAGMKLLGQIGIALLVALGGCGL